MASTNLQGTDAASLDRLHDIVLPEPIAWWPPAPGWYVVGALVLLALAILAWRAWRSWRRSAYRRAALAELEQLDDGNRDGLTRLPALLKRTALAAYERTAVASLSGDAWLEFLDAKGGTSSFTRGPGKLLPELSFRPGAAVELDEEEARELFAITRDWIEHHRPAAPERPPC